MKIEVKDLFIEIHADDGEYITIWDKVNLEEYSGSKVMYAPKTFDVSMVYAISQNEHDNLVAEQEKIMNENREKYDSYRNE